MQENQDLNFKKISLVHAPVFTSWRKDRQLGRQVGWAIDPKKWNISEEKRWIESVTRDPSSNFWVCSSKNGTVGRVGLYHIDFDIKSGEVSILIGNSSLRNKGYGAQMLEFVLDKAYNELLLEKVYATIFDDNPGAIRFFENNKFKKSGKTGVMSFLGEPRKFFYLNHIKD